METSSSTPSLLPRLRLSRRPANAVVRNDDPSATVAGPSKIASRSSVDLDDDEGEEERAQSTPRLSSSMSLPPTKATGSFSAMPSTETPAARLRALLGRGPSTSISSALQQPLVSHSESDSDFDPPPRFIPQTPSIARESLRDLFSHALREPGSSPEKGRMRRKSIDLSEVEAAPRLSERAKMKDVRKSLSDNGEETEQSTSAIHGSSRSSHAANLHSLRQRLTSIDALAKDHSAPISYESDATTSLAGHDTATFLRNLDSAQASPPVATSTPQKSLLLPSHIQSQSNLMEPDSDMQQAMGACDSYEGNPSANNRPPSFPSTRPPPPLSARIASHPRSSSNSNSHDKRPSSRHGFESGSGRAPSSVSGNSILGDSKQEHFHELEREWNKPKPKPFARPSTPEPNRKAVSQGSGSRASLGNGLPRARQDSLASLRSLDSGRSSRASSISSQMSYHEQRDEMENERNHERERDWNKSLPRSTSNLSLRSQRERVRTASNSASFTPLRRTTSLHSNGSTSSLQSQDDQRSPPGQDDQAFLSPKRLSHPDHALSLSAPSLRRQASFTSSATSSPTGSLHSAGSGAEYEVVLERERNWNARRPKWSSYQTLARASISSAPSSPGSDHMQAQTSEGRARTKSLTVASSSQLQARQSKERRQINPSASGPHSPLLRPPSNTHSPSPLMRAATYPPRPTSPLPRSDDSVHSKRFSAPPHPGWSFPRNRTSLPPLELEDDTVDKRVAPNGAVPTLSSSEPEQSQESPLVRRTVFSPPKKVETGSSNGQENETKKSHRRTPAESLPSPVPNDSIHVASSTPIDRPSNPVIVDLGAPERGTRPSTSHETGDHSANAPVVQQESSPPLSPLSETEGTITRSPPPSARATRRPTVNGSKMDFPLLSPPHGLPDLPEPPSFSGEDDKSHGYAHPDLMPKTPRPPGAWQDTPAPHRLSVYAFPDRSETEVHESGLATPAPTFSRARATSLPMQTPAFPGAWMATPGTDRRKSLLKVRFDIESEPSMSEGMSSEANFVSLPDRRGEDSDIVPEQMQQEGSTDFNPFIGGGPQLDEKMEKVSLTELSEPRVPASSRSPRRPATVRVVDAFGREEGHENRQDADVSGDGSSSNASLNKTTVRIVDAMGRELDNGPNAENGESILSHNEALWRLRQGIAELTEGWSDIDMSINISGDSLQRFKELENVSRAARETRGKLNDALGTAKSVDVELRSRLRQSMKDGIFPRDSPVPWWARTSRMAIWAIVFLQCLLVVVLYRVSTARAREMFLTTYYDPFYPDLHQYTTKPGGFRYTLSSRARNSLQKIPNLLDVVANAVFHLQQRVWETWGAEDLNAAWPPT